MVHVTFDWAVYRIYGPVYKNIQMRPTYLLMCGLFFLGSKKDDESLLKKAPKGRPIQSVIKQPM